MDKIHGENARNGVSKLGIALLMLTIIVLFTTLGAAFVRANKHIQFELPVLFYINTLILLGSSIFLHMAWTGKQEDKARLFVSLAVIFGLGFLISQGIAWGQLYGSGIDLANSGQMASYLYVLTGLHALHIVGGLGFLAYVYFAYEGNGKNYLESALFFWHFLGLLWIYLICLLLI